MTAPVAQGWKIFVSKAFFKAVALKKELLRKKQKIVFKIHKNSNHGSKPTLQLIVHKNNL